MAYSSDVNSKIITFLSRAQTKMSLLSKEIADKVSRRKPYRTYESEAELGFDLVSFIEALDNNYNDWTEDQILQYIQFWDNKARLTNYPYVQRSRFNVNVNFNA